jgi:hypothetical protein
MKTIFHIKASLLLIFLLCTIPLRSQTNEPCKWIRPVSWKYVKIHDIKDSSIFTLYGTLEYDFQIQKAEDSTDCTFNTDGYKKIYKIKEFPRYTGAPKNELFILPPGNYTFTCYPSGIITSTTNKWYSLTTREISGSSIFDETLEPGNYYKIVFVSIDTLTNNAWKQSYRAELRNITKKDIIRPSEKYRTLQYALRSAELVGLVVLLIVLL